MKKIEEKYLMIKLPEWPTFGIMNVNWLKFYIFIRIDKEFDT